MLSICLVLLRWLSSSSWWIVRQCVCVVFVWLLCVFSVVWVVFSVFVGQFSLCEVNVIFVLVIMQCVCVMVVCVLKVCVVCCSSSLECVKLFSCVIVMLCSVRVGVLLCSVMCLSVLSGLLLVSVWVVVVISEFIVVVLFVIVLLLLFFLFDLLNLVYFCGWYIWLFVL